MTDSSQVDVAEYGALKRQLEEITQQYAKVRHAAEKIHDWHESAPVSAVMIVSTASVTRLGDALKETEAGANAGAKITPPLCANKKMISEGIKALDKGSDTYSTVACVWEAMVDVSDPVKIPAPKPRVLFQSTDGIKYGSPVGLPVVGVWVEDAYYDLSGAHATSHQ